MKYGLLLLLGLLVPFSVIAADGPNNLIYVTAASQGNTGGSYACTANTVPYPCCTGSGAGTCDTTVNGADICMGLEACSTAGGCRLQLPAGTITEAEFRIYGTPWWTPGTNTVPCGGNYPNGFTNGLIIQGKGIGNTILEATITGNAINGARDDTSNYGRQSVIDVAVGGGLTQAELPKVVFQDFTIEGRREMQPNTVNHQGALKGEGPSGPDIVIPYLVIKRVRMQNTTSFLFDFGNYQSSVAGTTIMGPILLLQSELYGGGCLQGYPAGIWGAARTTANATLPCGCARPGTESTCAGWGSENTVPHMTGDDQNDEYPAVSDWMCFNEYGDPGETTYPTPSVDEEGTSSCPGWVNQGGSGTFFGASNSIIAANSFDLGAHFLLGGGHSAPGSCTNGYEGTTPTSPDSFSPKYCGTGWTVAKNHFRRSGGSAIDDHGSWRIDLTDNVFDGEAYDPNYSVADAGDITFANAWAKTVRIRRNKFSNSQTNGVELNFWRPLPSERAPSDVNTWPPVLVENNVFELDCARCVAANQICTPLNLMPGNTDLHQDYLTSSYAYELPDVLLQNNTFQNTDAVNNCTQSIATGYFQQTVSNGIKSVRGLTLLNETYATGGLTGSSTGWAVPGGSSPSTVYPSAALLNYVSGLRIEGVAVTGAGKITLGRDVALDDMAGGCYNAHASMNNRYGAGITTPCSVTAGTTLPFSLPGTL